MYYGQYETPCSQRRRHPVDPQYCHHAETLAQHDAGGEDPTPA